MRGGIVEAAVKTREEQAAQFRLALEMHEFGVAMMRQTLHRRFPDETGAEVEARVQRWLRAVEPVAPSAGVFR